MKYADNRETAVDAMIPGKIIRFLEERANLAFAGTRDANLVPAGHRVSGWRVDAAGRTLTALIPAGSATQFIDMALDNGRIAVTFGEAGTHETYQIKGQYLRHRPVEPAEIADVDRTRDRYAKALFAAYQDERVFPYLKLSIPAPSVAVDIDVREVYVQTPGPGAGARIAPPADVEAKAT